MPFPRPLLRLIAFLFLLATQNVVAADKQDQILDQKQELSRIKQDLEQGRKLLDSLKAAEVGLQKDISEYDQRITSNQKVIARLGKQLAALRDRISSEEEQQLQGKDAYERAQRRYLGNLRQFYLASREVAAGPSYRPNEELILQRQAGYLRAVAGLESTNMVLTSGMLQATEQRLKELSGETQRVGSLRRQKETAASLDARRKERREKELAGLHRQEGIEADRVLMLAQAAQEMEAIISRVERESRQLGEDAAAQVAPSIVATLKGHLGTPCRGTVVTAFGYSVDPVTRLKSFSPGISIKGPAGREVTAIAAGRVVYVGELRGYGSFVIVDHGGQYFSTYAGLAATELIKGDMVEAGTRLAVVDADGLLRFELRQGRQALDPVEWIKIDAL
jgi:septal ring factor EnvC (AmiA/AmiB activator)